jgi:hypothetical protein
MGNKAAYGKILASKYASTAIRSKHFSLSLLLTAPDFMHLLNVGIFFSTIVNTGHYTTYCGANAGAGLALADQSWQGISQNN